MKMQTIWQLLSAMRSLRQRDRWPRAQLEAHQAAALRRLRAYAYERSPFYQRFHRDVADRPLQDLPVLTKATLMENFDALVTDRAIVGGRAGVRFLGRYWVNATSGSTGEPGLFLFNRAEWTTVLASFGRAHEWAGLAVSLTHRMKMASVASTSRWHMSARVGESLKSWWMPALRLAASEPLETIVARLNDWRPEMLVSYASMARVLADEQAAGRLRIAPHLVFSATDYGEKVLLTVLFNRTQPLIRYELSDSLRLGAEPCPCGRPFVLVTGIQGRAEEVLRLPAACGGEVTVHPVVFHRVLDTVPAAGWQVVRQDGTLRVRLAGVRPGFAEEALADALRAALGVGGGGSGHRHRTRAGDSPRRWREGSPGDRVRPAAGGRLRGRAGRRAREERGRWSSKSCPRNGGEER